MTFRFFATSALFVIGSACHRTELLRDAATVQVDDTREQWSLVWLAAPKPVCAPEDESAGTCPCSGFSYGEGGALDLVRSRSGRSIERFHLTPLFSGQETPDVGGIAVLQRWPVLGDDYKMMNKDSLGALVRARPATGAIIMRDYDHDGRATEFVLQVGAVPCGKHEAVVVGISKSNPTLHAFTSVAHPERPLVLEVHIWNELLQSSGRVESVEWSCGDHGAETTTLVRLSITAAGIDAVRSEYQCKPDNTPGRLISTVAL